MQCDGLEGDGDAMQVRDCGGACALVTVVQVELRHGSLVQFVRMRIWLIFTLVLQCSCRHCNLFKTFFVCLDAG
jgi:hypothetical protein